MLEVWFVSSVHGELKKLFFKDQNVLDVKIDIDLSKGKVLIASSL